jgi:hypothetical protein
VSDQAVVMAVAGYPSRAAAERDFRSVCGTHNRGGPARVAAAMVEKGADGLLTIDHHSVAERFACGPAILGGALVVVAAPLGILFLVPAVASTTAWAGVGAIVAHFWNNLPKAELRHMTDLLETAPAVLVVVAIDQARENIEPLLTNASTAVVSDVSADLEAEFAEAVAAADLVG